MTLPRASILPVLLGIVVLGAALSYSLFPNIEAGIAAAALSAVIAGETWIIDSLDQELRRQGRIVDFLVDHVYIRPEEEARGLPADVEALIYKGGKDN